jgi:hypothetical protein
LRRAGTWRRPIPAPVVYYDAKDGGRRLEMMRWGLIPYWAKDIKIGFSTINARAEECREAATAGTPSRNAASGDHHGFRVGTANTTSDAAVRRGPRADPGHNPG